MSRKSRPAGELNGFLDKSSSFVDGELRFEDTFRVEGRMRADVASGGDLIVGPGSTVEGKIRVRRLFVSGVVRGKVQAERIEIAPGARVEAASFKGVAVWVVTRQRVPRGRGGASLCGKRVS